MATKLTNMKITKVAICEDGANSAARINLFKKKGDLPMNFEEIIKSLTPEQQEVINKACDKMKKETEDAEKEAKEAKEELAKAKSTVTTEEDIMKSASPEIQAMFKSMQAKQLAAETMAKSLKEEEMINLAKSRVAVLKSVPGEEAAKVEMLKSLNQKDSKLATDVFEMLEKANALIEKSAAFKATGNSNEGVAKNADAAWAEIEKAAEPLLKSMSKETAISQIMKEKPELYKSYLDSLE